MFNIDGFIIYQFEVDELALKKKSTNQYITMETMSIIYT